MATDPRAVRQRQRILALLDGQALSAQQIADRIHLTRDGVQIYLTRFRAEGLIRIASYLTNRQGGRPAPCYQIGTAPDAAYVPTRVPQCVDMAAERIKQIKRALRGGKLLSAKELAAILGLHSARVRYYLRQMRDDGIIRIGRYGKADAGYLPLYVLGSGPDMPRPQLDVAAQNRNYRARHREAINARRRFKDRLRSKPTTWLTALGL